MKIIFLGRRVYLLALLACAFGVFSALTVNAGVAYGTINNFDTVNDTGVECHGFEIEIEDLRSSDITYTYNWNHYGTPRILEDDTDPLHPRVRIRYESAKNPDGSWAAYTAIPSGPIAATDGHRFTDPSVNFGGEHFGCGYRGSPTNITYHWLIDGGAGNLVRGPAVHVSTPTFVYLPPAGGNPAQIQAEVKAPDAPRPLEFGPPTWVKVIRTSTHNDEEIPLRDLVSDDPDDPDDKNWRKGEPAEIEIEWQLLQIEYNRDDGGRNAKVDNAPANLEEGDEIVTFRYEFYKYIGPTDPESGEADTDNVGPDGIHGINEFAEVIVVGDYIGSQMSAFDAELPIGLIEHLPAGEEGAPYPNRSVVIAATSFTSGLMGALPPGLTFDAPSGILSGTPIAAGIFTFEINVTAENQPSQKKTYILPIAPTGEQLPPYSIVELASSPVDAGSASGGGFQINGTPATVIAHAESGFSFASWTENGATVSRSVVYKFTNIVHRTLVANFVPMPPLTWAVTAHGELSLSWPTNFPEIQLQETSTIPNSTWTSPPEPITILGANHQVIISPSPKNRFFRLYRP